MSKIFPKSANRLPLQIIVYLVVLSGILTAGATYYMTPKYTRVGYAPVQPVPYSPPADASPSPPAALPYGPPPETFPGTFSAQGLSPMTLAVYQNSKHSHGAALAIEFFLPGGGSIYGDHLAGALLTWGLEIGGVLLILTSFATQSTTDGTSTQVSEARLTLGMLALMGGRIYGLVDGALLWAWDIAALGQDLRTHASGRLERIE